MAKSLRHYVYIQVVDLAEVISVCSVLKFEYCSTGEEDAQWVELCVLS